MKGATGLRRFLIFGLLLLGSCTTHIQGLEADPSFSYGGLQGGGIAVGGVTSSVAKLSEVQANRYAGYFRNALVERGPGVRVISSGSVAGRLGGAQHQEMMSHFRTYQTLSDDWLRRIQGANVGAAYIALARINRDEVSYSDEQSEYEVEEKKDKKRKKFDITYRAKRDMSVFVCVYDLTQGRSVWAGSVDKQDMRSNTNTYSKDGMNAKLIADVAMAAIDASTGKKRDPRANYPAPPSEDALLKRIFAGFAENLPLKAK